MVKGVTRRVIVVKSPDPRYFEEAIFIVKEDVSVRGVDMDTVLQEARAVATGFTKTKTKRHGMLKKLSPFGYLAAGAALSALLITLSNLIV